VSQVAIESGALDGGAESVFTVLKREH
jgi:hypothetical protein